MVTAKSAELAPLNTMPETFRVASPVFDKVTTCGMAEVVERSWLKKSTAVVEITTIGAVPTPPRPTESGLVNVLLVTVILTLLPPRDMGEKVTLMVQVAFAASAAGQLFVWLKFGTSVPVKATEEIFIVALPEFLRTIATGPLERLTFTGPKSVKVDGIKLAAGFPELTPVPERAALSGLVNALVVKVKLAEREAMASGRNVTPTTQLDP